MNMWIYRFILLTGFGMLAMFYGTGVHLYAILACALVLAGAIYYFFKCTERNQNDIHILIRNSVFIGIMLFLFYIIH